MKNEDDIIYEDKSLRLLRWLSVVFFIVLVALTVGFLFLTLFGPIIFKVNPNMELRESLGFGGVSFATAISLLVVLSLRYTVGPIEFEGLGFKFRGASGPVVLWIFCFLAVIGGLALLTQITPR